MHVTFVSGWSGLPCLYPQIAANSDFIVPFYDHAMEQVNAALGKGGDVLIAWSTGAHLVLDQLSLASDKFNHILLIAPFLDFTTSVPARIIQRMHTRLLVEPEATVSDFWRRCGGTQQCPHLNAQQISHLAAGLDLLMNSQVRPIKKSNAQVTLVQCLADQVVLPATFNAVSAALEQTTTIRCHSAHMPPEPELIRIVSNVSGTAFI
jgi:hypothetical protein